MNKIKYTFLLASTIFITATAFAHGDLERLTKQEVTDIQKKLVEGKYLKTSEFKLGEVNLKTEDAYDIYQDDQFRARIQEENQSMATNTDNTLKDVETPKTFWQKIVDFFKNLF